MSNSGAYREIEKHIVMSKESIKASIETEKGRIAQLRTTIATIRSRKSEASARYAAKIAGATQKGSKDSYRKEKASVIAHIESEIRLKQSALASHQQRIASLRVMLKTAK